MCIFFSLFFLLPALPPPEIQPVSAPSNFFSRFTEQGEFSKGEYGEGRLCKVGLSEEEIRGPTGLPSLPPSFFFLFSIKNRRGIPTGAFSWLGIKVRDQYRSSERKKRDTEQGEFFQRENTERGGFVRLGWVRKKYEGRRVFLPSLPPIFFFSFPYESGGKSLLVHFSGF